MSDKQKIGYNKSKGRTYNIACENCQVETSHIVLQSVDISGVYENEYDRIHYWYDYQIIQCQGCKGLSFRKDYGDSDAEYDGYVQNPDGTYRQLFNDNSELYPKRILGKRKIDNLGDLPEKIRQLYEETHDVLMGKQAILATLGIRSLIEAVANEKGVSNEIWSLKGKIDELVNLGMLTKESSEVLHKIREIGNLAAHESVKPNDEALLLVMEIVENLLKTVFILPNQAKRKLC